MKNIKAVVFDLDGTLTDGVSWLSLTRGLGASVQQHSTIFKDLKEGKTTYTYAKKALVELWQATGKATKSNLEELFQGWPIKDEARDIITWLNQNGYVICLISGSVDTYTKILADRLNIHNYFANTKLIFNEDGELIDFNYELRQAQKKLEQFNIFCQQQKLTPEECLIVGDGDNEIDLFKATGNGVLLGNKDDVELKAATWKKIDSLNEIKDILV